MPVGKALPVVWRGRGLALWRGVSRSALGLPCQIGKAALVGKPCPWSGLVEVWPSGMVAWMLGTRVALFDREGRAKGKPCPWSGVVEVRPSGLVGGLSRSVLGLPCQIGKAALVGKPCPWSGLAGVWPSGVAGLVARLSACPARWGRPR